MNEFKIRKGLIVQGSGSIILDIQGSQGELFSVTDSLSGSLFSVNDISGIPIMEVFSDNTIKMGTFNQEAIIVSGSRTGMGVATPQAKLHISGASNSGLFEIDSPAVNNIIYVSGSGNVGIGTLTPTNTLNVNGTTLLQGGQTTVRGSGATSATTALRVENSNTSASLVITDNIRVGINKTTPNSELDVNGNTIITGSITSTSNITTLGSVATPSQTISGVNGWAPTSGTINLLNIAGGLAPTATAIINSLAITSTVSQSVNPTTIIRGILVSPTFNTLGPQYRAFEWNNNQGFGLYGVGAAPNYLSGSLGIGTTSPSASLHISGANADALFRVSSPSATNALFVSGSGNVGIGTATPSTTLQVAGTSSLQNIIFDTNNTYDIGTISTRVRNIWSIGSIVGVGGTFNNLTTYFTASIGGGASGFTPSANLHVSGASNSNLLRVSSPTQTNILFVSGSGNVGVGTTTPTNTLNVNGTTLLQGGQTTVRGSGATSATTALLVQNSTPTNLMTILDDGTMTLNGSLTFGGGNTLAPVNSSGFFSTSGTAIRLGDALASNSVGYQTHVFSPVIADRNFISGEGGVLAVGGVPFGRNFNPTSGNGVFNIIRISQIINQTGGASGITRGLFIDPTLTSAANWRSVEWNNNQGFGLYGVGAAPNYLSGSLGIGTTSPSASLHISGANAGSLFRVSSPSASAALFISGSGNVGIGTTNPQARLHISDSTSGSILEPTSSGVPTFTGRDGQFIFGSSGGNHFIYVYMAGAWRSSSLS